MKVITWNCNMAFRKKADVILQYKPDILIVPECESPEKLKFNDETPKPTDMLWFGKNPNKGLGIFSYCDLKFRLIRNHNKEIRMIIPIEVSNDELKFKLYAVWANNPDDPDGQYVEQVWKAVHHYNRHLKRSNTLVAGDFNSNTIFDRKYRVGNHSAVVKKLSRKGIVSCYHLQHNQVQGEEKHPTFYLYKRQDKPYHLDYCFASQDLAQCITSVEIGEFDHWMRFSDHVPVMVTFDQKK